MPWKRTALFCCLLLVVTSWLGCGNDDRVTSISGDGVPTHDASRAKLAIGPIDGLTTAWHDAPARLVVPIGMTVDLRCAAPPDAEVTWAGAEQTHRDDRASYARCPAETSGETAVTVELRYPEIQGKRDDDRPDAVNATYSCVIEGIDVDLSRLETRVDHVWAPPALDLDEASTNNETMKAFFDNRSIAGWNELAPGHYATSVKRRFGFGASVSVEALTSLIEWRVDGEAVQLGQGFTTSMSEPGQHRVSVGPPSAAKELVVDIYEVTITSHTTGVDFVIDGESVAFQARTTPPGFEQYITWLSSTRYGFAQPVLGRGATFYASFSDTWGQGGNRQWLGVRADNAAFHQDSKVADPCVPLPPDCSKDCPTGIAVAHTSTVTGTGVGTSYGEVFEYTLQPAGDYCIEVREVVTTAANDDGCNCSLPPVLTGPAIQLCCDEGILTDTITNTVNNPGTPCPCATVSTQELQCRKKGSADAWVTFHTQELKWERLANGDIRVTVTPQGGAAVSATHAGPACPGSLVSDAGLIVDLPAGPGTISSLSLR